MKIRSGHAVHIATSFAAALLLLAGCGETPPPRAPAPVLHVNASPAPPVTVASEAPLAEDVLKRPAAQRPRPITPQRPRGGRSANPRLGYRDPTRPISRARPAQPSPPPDSAPPPSPEAPPPSPPPRLELPQPEYPTAPVAAQPKPSTLAREAQAIDSTPSRLAAANGLGPRESEDSELFLLDEEPARPVYHPAVVIDGWRDEKWLTVRFDVGPNGRFRVALLEGTGDPAIDALALQILRQWRWEPKRVKRHPVASTEILRLKRNVTRRG